MPVQHFSFADQALDPAGAAEHHPRRRAAFMYRKSLKAAFPKQQIEELKAAYLQCVEARVADALAQQRLQKVARVELMAHGVVEQARRTAHGLVGV